MKFKTLTTPILAVSFTLGLFACSTAQNSRIPSSSTAPFDPNVVAETFQGDAWTVISPTQLQHYKDIYFMSDIHGRLIAFANLLHQAGLVDSGKVDSSGNASGNWVAKSSLLVLDGDYIDGGESSAQVLSWIQTLKKQAGSDMVVMLGNHEAEFLAKPEFSEMAKETRQSFGTQTDMSATVKELQSFKLGAVIGSWFVAHSGYIVPDSGNLKDGLSAMSSAWAQGTPGFVLLSDSNGKGPAGVLERHDWWEKNHDDELKTLSSLGLNGFVGGHEPDLFGSDKTKILISNDKWAVKIDTALKDASKDSINIGEMLHCKVSDILSGSGALKTLDHCSRLQPDGSKDKDLGN